MIGFVIWSLLGVFIIGLGIKDMFSKNPVGFWANTETIKVKMLKVTIVIIAAYSLVIVKKYEEK